MFSMQKKRNTSGQNVQCSAKNTAINAIEIGLIRKATGKDLEETTSLHNGSAESAHDEKTILANQKATRDPPTPHSEVKAGNQKLWKFAMQMTKHRERGISDVSSAIRKAFVLKGKKNTFATVTLPPAMKKGRLLQFRNCRLLRNHEIMREDLWVRDGTILNSEKIFFEEKSNADDQIDCGNSIIAPGFIDLQINGAFAVDFSSDVDGYYEKLNKVCKGLLAHGVTSFCPTMVTSPSAVYKKILPFMKRREGSKDGAGILGAHVEGPFLSKEQHGAHPIELVTSYPNGMEDIIEMYGSLDNICIITIAPEHENTKSVTKQLAARGITVSLGHSMANLREGEEAVCGGASFITHLFNAMLPFHHRGDPHLIGLLTSNDIPTDRILHFGLITDGVHTHPTALRIAHKINPKGLVIVTDGIPALGLGTGTHCIGQHMMEVRGNRAVIAGTDNLCGSIANFNECVQTFYQSTECSKKEALECATLHPARAVGILDRKGTLDYGTDADFVLLDDNLQVQATYIAGDCVWEGENAPMRPFVIPNHHK